jgi:prophage regulatory protein
VNTNGGLCSFDDELVDISGAEEISSLGGKTIYAYERKGQFPRRVKIGRRTAWVKRELHAWVREQMNARPEVPEYQPLFPKDLQRKPRKSPTKQRKGGTQ